MFVLKEIGASYYIGETNVQNEWMKDVFEKNGCQQLSSTERYVGKGFRRMDAVLFCRLI